MNIGSFFKRHAQYRPDHPAVVFENQRLTHREFNGSINRTANALRDLGVKKGEKVATLLPNCIELLEIYWAVSKIGAVVVPLSTLLLEGALLSLLDDSESVMVVTTGSLSDLVRPALARLPALDEGRVLLVDKEEHDRFQNLHRLKREASEEEPEDVKIDPQDVFNIMYSSGTTGLPKGIVHTHAIRIAYGTSFAASFRIHPESVVMHAGAIVFNGAFVDLMPAVLQGATYVLLPGFDPVSYIEAIEKERVTHVMMVPAQIIAMLETPHFDPDRLQSLEMILVLGAPLLMKHKEKLNRLLPDRFYELYGLTEGFVTVLDKLDYRRKPKSVGVPPPLFEMKIVDVAGKEVPARMIGEICGRGPILMPEYFKRPDLTKEAIVDGWLHSGDMGYVDEEGFLYLVDRKKDMIISGGVNVYPRDIEEIAVQHPAVREVAVFGIPDDRWGESPLAAVLLQEGARVTEESLKEWINAKVSAKFQRVSAVRIMADFPRNAAGKTVKREIRAEYW